MLTHYTEWIITKNQHSRLWRMRCSRRTARSHRPRSHEESGGWPSSISGCGAENANKRSEVSNGLLCNAVSFTDQTNEWTTYSSSTLCHTNHKTNLNQTKLKLINVQLQLFFLSKLKAGTKQTVSSIGAFLSKQMRRMTKYRRWFLKISQIKFYQEFFWALQQGFQFRTLSI